MTAPIALLFSLSLSLYYWGILRTAIWLVPSLFLVKFTPIFSISMLSFFAVVALFCPYEKGAFEVRKIKKDRWALIFFLTGALTGLFFYPNANLFLFAVGAGFPLFVVNFLKLLRQPPSQVLFLKKNIRRLPILLFFITALSAGLEYFGVYERLGW